MYGLRFRSAYPDGVGREFDGLLSALKAWLSVDHNEDGTHTVTDLTADTAVIDGDVSIGGALSVTQQTSWTREGVAFVTLGTTTHNLRSDAGEAIRSRVIRIDLAGASTLTGIVPYNLNEWSECYLVNGSNYDLTLSHNTGSVAAHRFASPTAADVTLASGTACQVLYNPQAGNWHILRG